MNLPQETLKEFLDYNPDTGIFTWKARSMGWFKSKAGHKMWNTRYPGKEAGYETPMRYITIRIMGRNYLAQCLVWLYTYGRWQKEELDHINHNGTDNRLTNLREVSHQENHQNKKLYSPNASGVHGVVMVRNSWVARITANKKRIFLGNFSNYLDAVCARKSAENKHGFHQNHGMT